MPSRTNPSSTIRRQLHLPGLLGRPANARGRGAMIVRAAASQRRHTGCPESLGGITAGQIRPAEHRSVYSWSALPGASGQRMIPSRFCRVTVKQMCPFPRRCAATNAQRHRAAVL
jgi:hypothetical protein